MTDLTRMFAAIVLTVTAGVIALGMYSWQGVAIAATLALAAVLLTPFE